jgi:hypothetical protein
MRLSSGLVAALVVAACSNPAEPTGETGPVLLEIEYVNYAWVPTFLGFFVDASGDVYSYDRNGAQWQNDDDEITHAELQEKFAPNRTLISSRDDQEIAVVAARIAQVVPGQLSQQNMSCADAGVLTYRAYHFNSVNRTYRPILLRSEGDIAQQNLSAPAQELIAYVRSLNLHTEFPGCDP